MKENCFKKVFDSRGRRVRGLWIRNGVFHAQIRPSVGANPVRIALHGVTTVPQAITDMQAKKKDKREGKPIVAKRQLSPAFSSCVDAYRDELKHTSGKRPATVLRELSSLTCLQAFFKDELIGNVPSRLMEYARERMKDNAVSGRAVDVDVIALRHVMKKSDREGIPLDYKFKWTPLAKDPARVRLVTRNEIDAMKAAALNAPKKPWETHDRLNQFCDYLELLALSGAREQEALRLRWSVNINWAQKKIGFGVDGTSKFGKERWMPLNPKLEAHLKSMRIRAGASDWLFPSRGSDNQPVQHYRKNLVYVMKATGIEDFGFHHLRHYFASHAVMSGVDFKTIAGWLGHSDGGRLVAETYSHLTEDHSASQAAKLAL